MRLFILVLMILLGTVGVGISYNGIDTNPTLFKTLLASNLSMTLLGIFMYLGLSSERIKSNVSKVMLILFCSSLWLTVLTIVLRINQNIDKIKFVSINLAACIAIFSIIYMLKLQRDSDDSQISKDDSLWKMGIFYYNHADKALFVKKRLGYGYTVNFARPLSYLFIAIILIVALLPIIFF